MARQELKQAIKDLNLCVESNFIPFSKSRNKNEKRKSLNWIISLCLVNNYNGKTKVILTTDYSAGEAHCPSYKTSYYGSRTVSEQEAINFECEHGKKFLSGYRNKIINPDECDVIASLVIDYESLDYKSFEDWAETFGYNADSRAAEATYKACLALALQLRAGLGDDAMRRLIKACEGY